MRVEIIAVGDELVSGQRLDTNSQWLSQRLGELGLPVVAHTTVGDDLELGVDAIQRGAQRGTIVVITGGLGPTADDLTRQCLAQAAGVPLELDEASLRHIEQLFARRQRPMPDSNRVQAMFPRGSRIIPNPHGSAPGIDVDLPNGRGGTSRVFALPGVPAEMREMWGGTVSPALQAHLPGGPQRIVHRQIKCFGVGESDLEQMLPDLIRRGRQPSVGITVHRATITLRITALGRTESDCQAQIGPTEQIIRECLGDLVFGTENEELQDVVVRELRRTGQTLTTVEYGTAGRLAWWLSRVPNSHDVYRRAMVLTQPQPNDPQFTTDRDLSEWAAATAAQAVRDTGSDLALVTGPVPMSPPRPLAGGTNPRASDEDTPRFVFALADRDRVDVQSSPYAGHPDILLDRSAKVTLNHVRRVLERGGRKDEG